MVHKRSEVKTQKKTAMLKRYLWFINKKAGKKYVHGSLFLLLKVNVWELLRLFFDVVKNFHTIKTDGTGIQFLVAVNFDAMFCVERLCA